MHDFNQFSKMQQQVYLFIANVSKGVKEFLYTHNYSHSEVTVLHQSGNKLFNNNDMSQSPVVPLTTYASL